jgi:hypothetical protein
MTQPERRNDLGAKVTYATLTALIGFLLALFLNHTYAMATKGAETSEENSKDIVQLKECVKNTNDKISEIKETQRKHYDISMNNNGDIKEIKEMLKSRK